ncbi:hypothetical protein SAMN02799631_03372 [Methylobacterium sp. 174MFSha1.1]|uniref:hypothetical protein n=1 Tax=Methylobacterium sp. 174MFSha1.1 TaxID=1502749 RepID=UPI0008E6CC89|nr:hypothetical protein [Methylobacterium sp. 174MFSha1.1]SFU94995.1 hypothetical protein SAMN02799631_03372 [Methylobacterium sp. 174MFSha1.1]
MNEYAVLALIVPFVAVGVAYVAVRVQERQIARLRRDLEDEAEQARRAALG